MQHVFADVNLGGFCRPDARLRPARQPDTNWCQSGLSVWSARSGEIAGTNFCTGAKPMMMPFCLFCIKPVLSKVASDSPQGLTAPEPRMFKFPHGNRRQQTASNYDYVTASRLSRSCPEVPKRQQQLLDLAGCGDWRLGADGGQLALHLGI